MSMKLTRMVNDKLAQWEVEAANYFCRIMTKGGTQERVQYPTGLIKVRASHGSEQVEVYLNTYNQINKSNWTICF